MDDLMMGIFPEIDMGFDRECATVLERCNGALEDGSFDELDRWDAELDKYRGNIARHTGQEF